MTKAQLKAKTQALNRGRNKMMGLLKQIQRIEKMVLAENRWDTWHVGGVREHLALPAAKK